MLDKERLITDNMGLVHTYVGRLQFPWWKDDLIQAGMEGLCHAAKTYDPDRGAFSTHAFWQIRDYISRFLKRAYLVYIPQHAYTAGVKHSYGEFREPLRGIEEGDERETKASITDWWAMSSEEYMARESTLVEEQVGKEEILNIIRLVVEDMSPYYKNLIKDKYWLEDIGTTKKELAHRHKVTRAIIEQDVKRAEAVLVKRLAQYGITKEEK